MELVPVTSSAIREIGWHDEIGLVVRFHGGNIWSYDDDDHALFDAIMAASSKGQAFDRLVKKRNVRGVEIAEAELQALGDVTTTVSNRPRRPSDPVTYLRELLKTNRQSAYF